VIAFWNFNHFVVVEGFGRHGVVHQRPRVGPRVSPRPSSKRAYRGRAGVRDRAGIRARRCKAGALGTLRKRLRGSELGLLYVVLASLALALTGSDHPAVCQVLRRLRLVANFSNWLVPLLGGMALAAALRAALTWLQRYYLLRLSTKWRPSRPTSSFAICCACPWSSSLSVMRAKWGRCEINDNVARLLSGELAVNLLNVAMVVLYVALMLCFDVLLTCVGLLMVGAQCLGAAVGLAPPEGHQYPPVAGAREDDGHLDGRIAGHRKPEGDGLRGRLLRPLVRPPRQGDGGQPGNAGFLAGAGAVPSLLSMLGRSRSSASAPRGSSMGT